MDWMATLSELPFWANVGSVTGALFTLIAFFFQLKTRRHYKLLIRGPELRDDLARIGHRLNEYEDASSQERKTVLGESRTLLQSVGTFLGWQRWMALWPVRVSLWWRWKSATPEHVENYYAEIQRLIVHIEHRIRDKEVEQ
jgi:hypothetical protein